MSKVNLFKSLKPSRFFLACLTVVLSFEVHAQTGGANTTGGVSIVQGTNPPHESAMLDITSTNKGVLIPRMTTAQRIAIAPKTPGLLVFDMTDQAFYFIDDANCWQKLESHKQKDVPTAAAGGDCNESSGKVPVGGVVMFHGDVSTGFAINGTSTSGLGLVGTQYEGWAICNGKNGTPDLRDRFIASTGTVYQENANGYEGGGDMHELSLQELPTHKHTVNSNAVTVTMAQHEHNITDPGHSHTMPGANGWSGGELDIGGGGNHQGTYNTSSAFTNITKTQMAGGGNADVVIDSDNFINTTGQSQEFDNRPRFYAIAFIMRIK